MTQLISKEHGLDIYLSPADALTPDAIQATCGVTAGCFASPAGCTGTSCDYLVAYAPQDDAIVFTASARIPADLGENAYVSIGLGSEPKMVKFHVIPRYPSIIFLQTQQKWIWKNAHCDYFKIITHNAPY